MSNHLALHRYKIKDFTRDSCEHCGLKYCREEQLPGREKPFQLKIQCESCVEAERIVEKINDVMRKTNALLVALEADREKNADKIRGFQDLIQAQKAKLKGVINTIRNFTKEQSHSKPQPDAALRRPYKE